MRKFSAVSFVIYLLYALLGGGLAIYNHFAIQQHNAEGGGLEGIGLAILLVVGIVVCAAGIVGVLLNGIHLGTGWRFFGVLCILYDLACAVLILSQIISVGGNPAESLIFIAATVPSLISFICNVKSLA